MESTGGLDGEHLQFARRFLQTAVVVDDEAYILSDGSYVPKGDIVAPTRHAAASSEEDRSSVRRGTGHTLNARSVMDSFAAIGVICGVVGPCESAMGVMRQADVVVLDWLLQEDDPECALRLLSDLLTGEADRNSLRLVAIYTGEARLGEICESVFTRLVGHRLDPQKESETTISYRHGRVVLYAKIRCESARSVGG